MLGLVEKMLKTERGSRWTVKLAVVSEDGRDTVLTWDFR